MKKILVTLASFGVMSSVDTEPFIGMSSVGFTVRHSRLVLAFVATYFTKMYDTQRHNVEFGTLSLSEYF